jgi:hypothetical protein
MRVLTLRLSVKRRSGFCPSLTRAIRARHVAEDLPRLQFTANSIADAGIALYPVE